MAEPFIGQIIQGGWNFAPRGYAFCAGQLLSIAQNTALFSLLGTTYGGNGQTTFGLPDLRGRSMINFGQGPGLSNYVLGQAAGTETVTLLSTQLPAHTHAVTNTNSANASSQKATLQTPVAGSILGRGVDNSGTAVPLIYMPANTTPDTSLGLNIAGSIQVQPTGNNQPVSVLSPYLAVTVCIALEGIFPSRN